MYNIVNKMERIEDEVPQTLFSHCKPLLIYCLISLTSHLGHLPHFSRPADSSLICLTFRSLHLLAQTYLDIFEGYFTLGGHGIEAAMAEHADELGGTEMAAGGGGGGGGGSGGRGGGGGGA